MKYENLKRVNQICASIKLNTELINDLLAADTVVVSTPKATAIRLSIPENHENENAMAAKEMINKVIKNCESENKRLTQELDQL